jgi:hypothetical protein
MIFVFRISSSFENLNVVTILNEKLNMFSFHMIVIIWMRIEWI